MASLAELGFNANDEPEQGDFPTLPAGTYKVIGVNSEWKDTKDGQSQYLKFEYQIVDGEYKGRKLWDMFNLKNRSAEASAIARAQFATLCRAVGNPTPKDSAELHNKPVLCKVAVKKYEGENRNEIKGYSPIGKASASTANSEKPPWMAS